MPLELVWELPSRGQLHPCNVGGRGGRTGEGKQAHLHCRLHTTASCPWDERMGSDDRSWHGKEEAQVERLPLSWRPARPPAPPQQKTTSGRNSAGTLPVPKQPFPNSEPAQAGGAPAPRRRPDSGAARTSLSLFPLRPRAFRKGAWPAGSSRVTER